MLIRTYEGNGSEDLSGAGALQVADDILDLRPTIGVKLEAYNLQAGLAPGVEERFDDSGYVVWHGRCSELNRGDARAILGFAKKEYLDPDKSSGLIRLAGRGAVEMWLRDPETDETVRAVGEHRNDRPDENLREGIAVVSRVMGLEGADTIDWDRDTEVILAECMARLSGRNTPFPTVLWGDHNSMHRRDAWRPDILPGALAAHAIAKLVDMGRIPNEPPQTIEPEMSPGRVGNAAWRYRGMLGGPSNTLARAAGFRSADKWHRTTAVQKHVLRGMIDQTMLSSYSGRPDFRVRGFRRLPRRAGHDHNETMADLELLRAAA